MLNRYRMAIRTSLGRAAGCIVASSLILGLGNAGAGAQEVITVPDEVACPACVIEFDTLLTLGGLEGPGVVSISSFSLVEVDRRGRLLVTNTSGAREISVFDGDGTFLHTVGQAGEGPGEYSAITQITAGDHGIHVFDILLRRRTLLDYDFNVVRTDPVLGWVVSAAPLEGDDVILYSDLRTSASVGHPLHIMNGEGRLESFGADGTAAFRGQLWPQVLARRGDDVWSIETQRNRITRWSLDDRSARTVFVRSTAWFDDNDTAALWPRSTITALHEGPEGLWIIGAAPDPDFHERIRIGPFPSAPLPAVPDHEIFDGWVELLDPDSGRTLVRTNFDGRFLGFTGTEGYLVGYMETELGVPYIHVLRPRIRR